MYSIKKDKNINLIRKVINQESPESEIILFGSRVSGDVNDSSDYDLLIKIKKNMSVAEKRSLSSRIRKGLAEKLIDSDVIVKDEAEIYSSLDKPGSVIKEAVLNGIKL
jgi:predicted nucleotidyltransferase